MITYATLETYKQKCEDGLSKVLAARKQCEEQIEILDKQEAVVSGQIAVLEQLMDVETNPPIVEIPHAGDKIEKLFEDRLEFFEGKEPEEFYKARQEATYKREAMDAVKSINAINVGEATQPEPERDS